jgi:hypothetical protein
VIDLDDGNEYISWREFKCGLCLKLIVKVNISNCGHNFCESCLDDWLIFNKICPVCKKDLRVGSILSCYNFDELVHALVSKNFKLKEEYLNRVREFQEYNRNKK